MQRPAPEIALDSIESAPALLAFHARTRPDAIAIVESEQRAALGLGPARRLAFAEADQRAGEIAALLLELGLKPGETVALQLPNIAEQFLIMLGAWRAGMKVSALPLLWRRSEIARAFGLRPPRVVITAGRIGDHDHAVVMRDLAAEFSSVRHVFGIGTELPDGVAALDPLFDGEPFVRAIGEGSTFAPRDSLILWTANAETDIAPVLHSQLGLIALGRLAVRTMRIDTEDRLLVPYPPTGVAGLGLGPMAWLISGATLLPHPPFDFRAFALQLSRMHASHVAAPNAVIETLAADGALTERAGLDAVACVWPGPRRSYPALAGDGIAAPLYDAHNLAQLGLSISRRRPGDDPARVPLGRLGEEADGPCPVETRVRGSVRNGGGTHALVGELYLRGAAITPQDEAGLAFVNTRIACAVDEEAASFVRCERDPRVIQHGGVSVCAAELDALYAAFPGYLDAAAVSLPDKILGERLFAAIVPRPDHAPSIDAFVRHLDMREVAPYKIPDQLVVVKRIPRGVDGAVLRDSILDQI